MGMCNHTEHRYKDAVEGESCQKNEQIKGSKDRYKLKKWKDQDQDQNKECHYDQMTAYSTY